MKKSEAVFALAKLISPEFDNMDDLNHLLEEIKDDWEIIIQQANQYLLVPALYLSLKQKGVYSKLEDEMLKGYLHEIYTLNRKRNEAILAQLQEICIELGNIEITPLLLKGATALSEEHFDDIAQRSMMDIDIVVPEEKIFEAVETLKNIGYKEINPNQELGYCWHHYRRLYKPKGATSVELHRMVITDKASKYMKIFEESSQTKTATRVANAKVFNPTLELYYAFLHSEIGHDYHHRIISLRHLHHSSVLITKYRDKIDFQKLQNYMERYRLQKVWYEYLWIIHRLFLIDIPIEVPPMVRYEKKISNNIDTKGSFLWVLKIFLTKTINAFSFRVLKCKNKNLKYRYQLLYYIPKRFIFLSYKIVNDKEKRDLIIKSLYK